MARMFPLGLGLHLILSLAVYIDWGLALYHSARDSEMRWTQAGSCSGLRSKYWNSSMVYSFVICGNYPTEILTAECQDRCVQWAGNIEDKSDQTPAPDQDLRRFNGVRLAAANFNLRTQECRCHERCDCMEPSKEWLLGMWELGANTHCFSSYSHWMTASQECHKLHSGSLITVPTAAQKYRLMSHDAFTPERGARHKRLECTWAGATDMASEQEWNWRSSFQAPSFNLTELTKGTVWGATVPHLGSQGNYTQNEIASAKADYYNRERNRSDDSQKEKEQKQKEQKARKKVQRSLSNKPDCLKICKDHGWREGTCSEPSSGYCCDVGVVTTPPECPKEPAIIATFMESGVSAIG
eukprot:CAMPEP_0197858696 /NCGR_PEP_ID=MMETSP1438-20131217/32669_1 /TAXON_ID=1461541 /ORGANISM="Pterosperma sp., Strain CCMP1384" /LENGTH=353 /DNA_ID=CAMNT_0043474935 /DNA_START=238 /DNA_END=1296 /DNA_ORIENTATION=-